MTALSGLDAVEALAGTAWEAFGHVETDGFEFMVPAEPRDQVTMKDADIAGWIEVVAAIGRDELPGR